MSLDDAQHHSYSKRTVNIMVYKDVFNSEKKTEALIVLSI